MTELEKCNRIIFRMLSYLHKLTFIQVHFPIYEYRCQRINISSSVEHSQSKFNSVCAEPCCETR